MKETIRFHKTVAEINKIIAAKDRCTSWVAISTLNKSVAKLKERYIVPIEDELQRQLPLIKQAVSEAIEAGAVYYNNGEGWKDHQYLEEFFIEERGVTFEEIKKHVLINAIDFPRSNK